jgi:hypothetical protein
MSPIDRRSLLASAAAAGLSAGAPAFAAARAKGHAAAPSRQVTALNSLLAKTSEALLTEYPDDATFLGMDTGPRAALHGKLTDRSIARGRGPGRLLRGPPEGAEGLRRRGADRHRRRQSRNHDLRTRPGRRGLPLQVR